jgi:hypothetical protein
MYYIGLDVHKKTISYCVKDVWVSFSREISKCNLRTSRKVKCALSFSSSVLSLVLWLLALRSPERSNFCLASLLRLVLGSTPLLFPPHAVRLRHRALVPLTARIGNL